MIPKVIHYCWFGRNPLPELALKCIDSWRKFLPDHEILEWNEDNFDVYQNRYVEQAYLKNKFAFVSDFARYKILYENGGLYFDTDVEIIKPIDDIILSGSFMALESPGNVATGLGMGCIKGLPLIHTLLIEYTEMEFILPNGKLNQKTIVDYTSKFLRDKGLNDEDAFQIVDDFNIYPKVYFNPMNYDTKEIFIESETRSIHHYAGSWVDETTIILRVKHLIAKTLGLKLLKKIQNFTHRNDKFWKK